MLFSMPNLIIVRNAIPYFLYLSAFVLCLVGFLICLILLIPPTRFTLVLINTITYGVLMVVFGLAAFKKDWLLTGNVPLVQKTISHIFSLLTLLAYAQKLCPLLIAPCVGAVAMKILVEGLSDIALFMPVIPAIMWGLLSFWKPLRPYRYFGRNAVRYVI